MVLSDVLAFRYKVCEFLPLVGREYKQLPTFLAKKKAIINVRNTDNRCFGYAMASARASALGAMEDHVDRAVNYHHLSREYGLDQLHYPVEVDDIPAIEDKLGVGINVYSFFDDEGKGRHPVYATEKAYERTIDLLYWDEHYAWIKNFRRFMADLSRNNTLHWCRRSIGHFYTEDVLKTHKLYCRGVETTGQMLILPDKNRKIKFENEQNAFPTFSHFSKLYSISFVSILKHIQVGLCISDLCLCHCRYIEKAPFVVYADFEALVISRAE